MAYHPRVPNQSKEFDSLVQQLEGVLAEQARMGVGFSILLAERRLRIEQELMRLLQPGTTVAEKRRSVRVPCNIGGRLRTRDGQLPVTIINLGGGGACIELDRPPPLDDDVELEFLMGPGSGGEIISRFGQVVWVNGRYAGIAFEPGTEPLDQHILRFILELLRRQ